MSEHNYHPVSPEMEREIEESLGIHSKFNACMYRERCKQMEEELNYPWILVDYKLPPEDEEVLVRLLDGSHEFAWTTYWHNANGAIGFNCWTFRDTEIVDEVPTHWMRIPK